MVFDQWQGHPLSICNEGAQYHVVNQSDNTGVRGLSNLTLRTTGVSTWGSTHGVDDGMKESTRSVSIGRRLGEEA